MLNERSYIVPSVFSQFTAYNKLESHRHRKRTMLSMSREELLIKVKSLTQGTRNVTKNYSCCKYIQSCVRYLSIIDSLTFVCKAIQYCVERYVTIISVTM